MPAPVEAFDTIPQAMRQHHQWVVWQLVQKPGKPKPDKIPISPHTGNWASVSDPSTWGSYDDAIKAVNGNQYAGIGFVFTQQDSFAFCDFDSVKTDTGWDPLIAEAMSNLPSWAEYSQSGEGMHIICQAEGIDAAKCSGLELYFTGRFVALTGRHVPTSPKDIHPCQDGVDWLRTLIRSRGGQEVRPAAERPTDVESEAVEHSCNVLQAKSGKLEIECPWGYEHANGDPTGAVYMPAFHNGREAANFYCQHATCQGLGRSNIGAFRAWLRDVNPGYAAQQAQAVFQPVEEENARLRDVSTLDLTALTPRPWLYGRHVMRGYLTILHGPGGVGKSVMALTDAIAMASGRNLMGRQSAGPLKVVYICNEDDLMEIQRRLAGIAQHYQIDLTNLPGQLTLASGYDAPFWVYSASQGAQTDSWIEALSPYDVAYVDPLISLHRGISENSNEEMEQFMSCLRVVTKNADVGMVAVAHNRKGSKEDSSEEDLRGASAQKDAARLTFVLARLTEKQAEEMKIDWEMDGRHMLQMFSGKLNFAPHAAHADWYKLHDVEIITGDHIGVPGHLGHIKPDGRSKDSLLDFVVQRTLEDVMPLLSAELTSDVVSINLLAAEYSAYYIKPDGGQVSPRRLRDLLKYAVVSGRLKGKDLGHGRGGTVLEVSDECRPNTSWMD